MTDEEIKARLKPLTVRQLIHLREEAVKRDTPHCWALRFFIIRELLIRSGKTE